MSDKNAIAENITSGSKKLPKPKRTTVSVRKLRIDPLNPRMDAGNNVLGIDTTNTAELLMQVKNDGEILKPLALHLEPDGFLNVLGGGRRIRVANIIINDPTSSKELLKAMENIPADVYEGLNDEQKLFLINDQDQKKFRFTELVNLIFHLYDAGLQWHEVAGRVYRQYGELTGGVDHLNQLDSLAASPEAWIKKLKGWLKGGIAEVYGEAHRIGYKVKDILLTEAAEKDKLIITKANAPKELLTTAPEKLRSGPYCYLIGQQARFDDLRKAKEADMANGNWTPFDGGPEFNNLLEKYHNEDYHGTPKAAKPKALGREKLLEVAKTCKSNLAANLLKLAAGDKNADGSDLAWKEDDNNVALFNAKKTKYLQGTARGFKNEAIKTAAYMLMLCDDFDKFKAWFEDQLLPASSFSPPTQPKVEDEPRSE